MNDELARAVALATSIKTLAMGPAVEGLAAELLQVLARVSIAVACADAVEPAPPPTAAASTEVISPPPPSSGRPASSKRPPSMTRDAIRARAKRAAQRAQLELGLDDGRSSLAVADGRRDPTTTVPLSTLTDLDQSDQRETAVGRSVVALDHTTPLDDELLGIAAGEMSRRAVVFDIPRAWASFVAHFVEKPLTRKAVLAKWKRWCAVERPGEPAPPSRPVEPPADVDDAELPLEPGRPPYSFLEAARGVRSDLADYHLWHSFERFARRHPMHATVAAALEHWLKWVRGEDKARIGPKTEPDVGKPGQKSDPPSSRTQTRYAAPEQKPGINSARVDDVFAFPYPSTAPSTGSLRACSPSREERGRDPPSLAASA